MSQEQADSPSPGTLKAATVQPTGAPSQISTDTTLAVPRSNLKGLVAGGAGYIGSHTV